MINKIGKITIYVDDQEEAKKFWVEKLNFVVKFEQNMGENMKWLEVAPKEIEFTTFVIYEKKAMLKKNPNLNVSHPNIILSTSCIEDTYNELKNKGVELGKLLIMPYGKICSFKDQDNNEYLIREDKY